MNRFDTVLVKTMNIQGFIDPTLAEKILRFSARPKG
jgi:hypothetical protein